MLIAWWISATPAETVLNLGLEVLRAVLGADRLQPVRMRVYDERIEAIIPRLFRELG